MLELKLIYIYNSKRDPWSSPKPILTDCQWDSEEYIWNISYDFLSKCKHFIHKNTFENVSKLASIF